MNSYSVKTLRTAGRRQNVLKYYILVFIGAGLLYGATCAPGALWQDSGMIQYRVWHNDIEGKLGLALSHPLFYILAIGAKYITPGEFGFRVNMLTAVTSAAAVANVFLLLRIWTKRNLPGLIAALSLGLSHTFWRHGAIAETYNLYIALLMGELIVLLQYCRTRKIGWLYGLAFLNGLAIANHMLGVFGLVCYDILVAGLMIKKKVRLKHATVMCLLWVSAAAPFIYLIVKTLIQTGDIGGTAASALFGTGYQQEVLNTHITGRIVKENILFFLMNFPTPNIFLAVVGLYLLPQIAPKGKYAAVITALLIMFFVFAFRYTIVDRYAFFIPFYAITAILIGLGGYVVLEGRRSKVVMWVILLCTLLPIGAYAIGPGLARKAGLKIGTQREIPYRDDCQWFLQPWRRGYDGAERFADEAIAVVEDDAVIYADNTTVYPLLYAQEVHGKGETVTVISKIVSSENALQNIKHLSEIQKGGTRNISIIEKGRPPQKGGTEMFNEHNIDSLLAERSVYVVTPRKGYCPEFLLDNYDFEKKGVLYKVVKNF